MPKEWVGSRLCYIHSSKVCTALGWTEEDASFWPAKRGARAMTRMFVGGTGVF